MPNDEPIVESYETEDDGTETRVTLPDGFEVRFWVEGMEDDWYIDKAKTIRDQGL